MWIDRSVVRWLGLSCTIVACAKPTFAPSGVNVTSDRSDYSPTAQLAVAVGPLNAHGDTVEIVVDSGSLAVPGEGGGDAGAMYNVHVAALVVTRATAPKGNALPRPWLALAESDSQLVLASIARGERRAIGPLRLRVVRPASVDPRDAWVVFRITGIVIPKIARMEGQRLGPTMPGAQGFRVYACADWNLSGRIDRRRAKVMQTSYLKAC